MKDNTEYIDKKKIFNKFEVTNIIESDDILRNYQTDVLKDFTPDKPSLASDANRKNNDSVGRLNHRYLGSRSKDFIPNGETFLGDLTKDPRSIHDGPLMGNYRNQLWDRRNDYSKSFKNDNDYSIKSDSLSQYKINMNKKKVFQGFKEKYKIDDDSFVAFQAGRNLNIENKSKVNFSNTDNKLSSMVFNKDSTNKQSGRENFSAEKLATMDHKNKLSINGKHYSSKNTKGNFMKNKNQSISNLQNKDEKINNINKNLILELASIKNRKETGLKSTSAKFNSSEKLINRKINTNTEYMKNNDIINTIQDQKKARLSEELTKIFANSDIKKDISKNVSDFTSQKIKYNFGNNKENKNLTTRDKNEIISNILRKSLMSEKNILNGNNKETMNNKKNIHIDNTQQFSKFMITNTNYNKDRIQGNNSDIAIYNYKNKRPETFDNYNNVKSGKETVLSNYDKEKLLNTKQQINNYSIKGVRDFEMDSRFNSHGEVKRAAGTVGVIGSKYMFDKHEIEDRDQSISESLAYN